RAAARGGGLDRGERDPAGGDGDVAQHAIVVTRSHGAHGDLRAADPVDLQRQIDGRAAAGGHLDAARALARARPERYLEARPSLGVVVDDGGNVDALAGHQRRQEVGLDEYRLGELHRAPRQAHAALLVAGDDDELLLADAIGEAASDVDRSL